MMVTVNQTDLFGQPVAPRRAAAVSAPTAPTLASLLSFTFPAWERLLVSAGNIPVEIMVNAFWTGVVIEDLSRPGRRALLHRDGQIQEVTPVDDTVRRAFVTAREARRIATRIPLFPVGMPGTAGCRLRQADQAWPDLSDWLDGIEAVQAHDFPSRW